MQNYFNHLTKCGLKQEATCAHKSDGPKPKGGQQSVRFTSVHSRCRCKAVISPTGRIKATPCFKDLHLEPLYKTTLCIITTIFNLHARLNQKIVTLQTSQRTLNNVSAPSSTCSLHLKQIHIFAQAVWKLTSSAKSILFASSKVDRRRGSELGNTILEQLPCQATPHSRAQIF